MKNVMYDFQEIWKNDKYLSVSDFYDYKVLKLDSMYTQSTTDSQRNFSSQHDTY